MPTTLQNIRFAARLQLNEPVAAYWSDEELLTILVSGVQDLWRDIVDLKQEHFLTVDITNVSLAAATATLSGVPTDVHKVYLIEPRDITDSSANYGLVFQPLDYNHPTFQLARSRANIEPKNDTIYYAITSQGAPVAAPTIRVAPKVTSATNLAFSYVPTLATLTASSNSPIPGEANNALVAWTVAYARAKEREDRSPDPSWLAIYATEKSHILQSLGLRQYQENTFSEAIFASYW